MSRWKKTLGHQARIYRKVSKCKKILMSLSAHAVPTVGYHYDTQGWIDIWASVAPFLSLKQLRIIHSYPERFLCFSSGKDLVRIANDELMLRVMGVI